LLPNEALQATRPQVRSHASDVFQTPWFFQHAVIGRVP